jgi:hypothetical protein
VNKETIANTTRVQIATMYTPKETGASGWITVAVATNAATEMRATPSTIHSMVMIRLLSIVILPKSAITPLDAKRCATPQIPVIAEAIYSNIGFIDDSFQVQYWSQIVVMLFTPNIIIILHSCF